MSPESHGQDHSGQDHSGRDGTEPPSAPVPPPEATRSYAAGPEQVYDVRFPRGGVVTPAPGTVVVVHGGFWRARYDRAHAGPQAVGLTEAGWTVAVAEYRRTGMPGGAWPGPLEDVTALVEAVRADPDLPGPVVLMGHSAGGHLVARAANEPWASDLAGVIVLSGCVDLAEVDRLHLGDGAARDFLGRPLEHPDRWADADPARTLPARCPVVLVHAADDDEVPVSVAESYVAATGGSASGPAVLDVVEGAGHYDLIDPTSRAWPRVLAALGRFSRPARG